MSKSKTCTWTEVDTGDWDTSCGQCHCLNDGTPEENSMKFCCYCGKELDQVEYSEEEA